jgi:hypothetical protein
MGPIVGPSSDASLATFQINGSDVANGDTVNIPYTTSVTVTATPTDSNASVQISGDTGLVVGNNAVSATVTAQDGTTQQVYSVTVVVADLNYAEILNGSFESPVVGAGQWGDGMANSSWNGSTNNNTGNIGITGANSPWCNTTQSGDQCVYIQQGGIISQNVKFAAGTAYTLSFWAALRPGYPSQSLKVSVNGTEIGTFTPSSDTFENIVTNSFTPGEGVFEVAFEGIVPSPWQDVAIAIDNVSISAV